MKQLTLTIGPRKRKRLTRPGALLATLALSAGFCWAQERSPDFTPPPITVPDGFEVTLAAAPPLVGYPMMACLDELGRLYLAESDGRNLTTRAEIEKELPRFVRRLVDTDGDGVFDQSTIFADKMTMPEGGLWHNGALYIISAPYLWRLEDTDDDGVADKREKILGAMEFDGRANQHGPYLGPNGRLYFTGGHFGYQFTGTDGSKTGHSRLGGVFSCRPDGSDVRIDGQGPLNPVEVVFTESGEMLSTCAIYDSFGGQRHDALVHWIHGGLTQRLYGVPLIPDTGARLPALSRWGQVAPAGLVRYRGTSFGEPYRDTLFACQFNTHKVVHVRLRPSGAAFTTEESDFLTSSSVDFHPTDILEDADGSLLLLDTGGWLSWGCPFSQTSKPEIKGAIYRIRKKGAKKVADSRGFEVPWEKLPSYEVANLLGDPRPAVRDRAQALLLARGPQAAHSVVTHLENNPNPRVRQRCVWTLSQFQSPSARASVCDALADKDARVRRAAARSVGEMKYPAAVTFLIQHLTDENAAVRRAAATALGQIGDRSAVAPLFDALQPDSELYFQHAVTLALIEIGNQATTLRYLAEPAPPHHKLVALRVLNQIGAKDLAISHVVPLLASAHPALRDEARRVIAGRQEWRDEVIKVFQTLTQEKDMEEQSAHLLEAIVLSLTQDEEFHAIITQNLEQERTPLPVKFRLLASFSFLESLPESLHPALRAALKASSPALKSEALAVLVRFQAYEAFSQEIDALSQNAEEDNSVRIAALEAIAQQRNELNAENVSWLASWLRNPKTSPLLNRQASRALSHLQLTPQNIGQAEILSDLISSASPLHLASLLQPFESLDSTSPEWPKKRLDDLGVRLAAALEKSPGREALPPEQLIRLAETFAPAFATAHQALRVLVPEPGQGARQREAKLGALLKTSNGGNASRGRILFHSNRAACTLCHRVDGRGGSLGPNLSKIAAIRSRADLLEAIVFPSATVVNGFETYLLTDKQSKTHQGLVQRETQDAVYLRGADQRLQRVPRATIVSMTRSPISAMPTGLDQILTPEELADLLAFLEDCR